MRRHSIVSSRRSATPDARAGRATPIPLACGLGPRVAGVHLGSVSATRIEMLAVALKDHAAATGMSTFADRADQLLGLMCDTVIELRP